MHLNSTIKKILSQPLILLFIVYCGVSFYLFQKLGVKIVNDSERYLTYAHHLQSGFYFDAHNFWYFTYSLFIYCIQLFTTNPLWIIIAQYFLCFLAVIALYKTYLILFGDKIGAAITGLLYIVFIEILSWNSYILCESLFCSLTCFSLYWLSKMTKTPTSFSTILSTGFVIIITILSKPSGIALLGAIIFTVIMSQWKLIPSKKLKVGLVCAFSIAFLFLINQMLSTFMLVENYITGDIIYAASTLPELSSYNWLVITPPKNLSIPSVNLPPLVRLASFITANCWFWLQLFMAKIAYFIFHIRPYWSLTHNVFTLSFLLPLYLFSGLSILKHRVPTPLLLFSLAYLLLHTLIVGITSVDWDGRFLMPVLPLIFILGVASIRTPHH